MEIEGEYSILDIENHIQYYNPWQWFTFSHSEPTPIRKTIDLNLTYLKEWALAKGIVSSANEKHYPFIGDGIPSIGRTKKSGIITYDIKPLVPELKILGLPADGYCIILHMDPLIEQKDKNENINNIFSLCSMKKLVHAIRKRYQNIDIIVAESWLLDSPVGRRLGFYLLPKESKGVPWNDGFWGQFIDQYGNIHRQRATQFLKTGKPPYEVRIGYILTRDIL